MVGLAQGTLTADQSKAILDTMPTLIRAAIGPPGSKLGEQVSTLYKTATQHPEANLETPEATQALSQIMRECNANGTPAVVMGEGG